MKPAGGLADVETVRIELGLALRGRPTLRHSVRGGTIRNVLKGSLEGGPSEGGSVDAPYLDRAVGGWVSA